MVGAIVYKSRCSRTVVLAVIECALCVPVKMRDWRNKESGPGREVMMCHEKDAKALLVVVNLNCLAAHAQLLALVLARTLESFLSSLLPFVRACACVSASAKKTHTHALRG